MQKQFYVGFHCVFFDDGLFNAVVEADQRDGFLSAQEGSISIYTGVAMGWVSVEVRHPDAAPLESEPLLGGQWSEVASVVVPYGNSENFVLHATSSDVSDDVLIPKPASGAIGVRVRAWGRDLLVDRAFDEFSEPVERYLVEIWAAD